MDEACPGCHDVAPGPRRRRAAGHPGTCLAEVHGATTPRPEVLGRLLPPGHDGAEGHVGVPRLSMVFTSGFDSLRRRSPHPRPSTTRSKVIAGEAWAHLPRRALTAGRARSRGRFFFTNLSWHGPWATQPPQPARSLTVALPSCFETCACFNGPDPKGVCARTAGLHGQRHGALWICIAWFQGSRPKSRRR
jgi:hypothetical protein